MTDKSPEQLANRYGRTLPPDDDAPDATTVGADIEAEGAQLLDDIETFLGRFVVYPSAAALTAHALWITHTFMMECWLTTPRIAFLSAEKESGKTRALEITELLACNPILAVNVTSAYLFRKIGESADGKWWTILFDEIDTVFGPKAREHEEVRGLLNAGYRRTAVAGRCTIKGRKVVTEEIPAYSAVAVAGIGNLPDTILSRSIIVQMQRRALDEPVETFRQRAGAKQTQPIRERITAWTDTIRPAMQEAEPKMPVPIVDRQADMWEALLAIADAAGAEWGAKAREAAVALVEISRTSSITLGVLLLTHMKIVFGDQEKLFTEQILEKLIAMEEAPWGDLMGKPLTARGLAKYLRRYKIKSAQIRGHVFNTETNSFEEKGGKGYKSADFEDAWRRYVSSSDAGFINL